MPPHGAGWMGERTLTTARPSRRSQLEIDRWASRERSACRARLRRRVHAGPTFDEEGDFLGEPCRRPEQTRRSAGVQLEVVDANRHRHAGSEIDCRFIARDVVAGEVVDDELAVDPNANAVVGLCDDLVRATLRWKESAGPSHLELRSARRRGGRDQVPACEIATECEVGRQRDVGRERTRNRSLAPHVRHERTEVQPKRRDFPANVLACRMPSSPR